MTAKKYGHDFVQPTKKQSCTFYQSLFLHLTRNFIFRHIMNSNNMSKVCLILSVLAPEVK